MSESTTPTVPTLDPVALLVSKSKAHAEIIEVRGNKRVTRHLRKEGEYWVYRCPCEASVYYYTLS